MDEQQNRNSVSNQVGEVQVGNGYYLTEEYASIERFISYFYQLDTIRNVNPSSILIIGVGDDVIPNLLRKAIPKVTTLDIDKSLQPDVVGDVRSLPFEAGTFDLVCAFQVLEHLPFDEQDKILSEMNRVSNKYVILAVPHRRTGFEIVLKFPFMRTLIKKDFLRLSLLFPIKFAGFEASGQHYWEIDWFTTKLSAVREKIKKHFVIYKEFTPVLDPYRRFFVLKKK
jgi:SAM-dependent methyltransferase